jgi:hypothetical protein
MNNVDIPKYTLISYLRDKNGEPKGVLVATKMHEGGYNVGYSFCSKYDRFCKKLGLRIALGRASFVTDIIENMPRDLRKILPKFIQRCEKYYKVS